MNIHDIYGGGCVVKRLFLSAFVVLLLAGCQPETNLDFNKHSTLFIKEQSDDSEGVDDFKTLEVIEDTSKVHDFVRLFNNFDWETNMDVDFEHLPDYLLNNYGIWVSPERDRLQIKNLDNSNYASLTKKDSKTLFNMLTGLGGTN